MRTLEGLGYTVEVAGNGREAVELLAADAKYDLVLMDCQMPIMDGFAATRHIRTVERESGAQRIPIIALTAGAMTGDRQRCLDAGMDDYVAKPFHSKDLVAAIARFGPKTELAR